MNSLKVPQIVLNLISSLDKHPSPCLWNARCGPQRNSNEQSVPNSGSDRVRVKNQEIMSINIPDDSDSFSSAKKLIKLFVCLTVQGFMLTTGQRFFIQSENSLVRAEIEGLRVYVHLGHECVRDSFIYFLFFQGHIYIYLFALFTEGLAGLGPPVSPRTISLWQVLKKIQMD